MTLKEESVVRGIPNEMGNGKLVMNAYCNNWFKDQQRRSGEGGSSSAGYEHTAAT